MPSHYTITIQPNDGSGTRTGVAPLTFEIVNHDDLFAILSRIEANAAVPPAEAAEFVFGLKLFLEVLIRHRKDALFAELWSPMSDFVKRLKALGPRTPAYWRTQYCQS